jgi:hypothetical protein
METHRIKVIVVIFPWRWLILSGVEIPEVCVCVYELFCSLWLAAYKQYVIQQYTLHTDCTSSERWPEDGLKTARNMLP